MKNEMMKNGLWRRLGALAMAMILIVGMIPPVGAANIGGNGADDTGATTVADPATLTRPGTIYGDNTLNAGKITVGKSVSAWEDTNNGSLVIDGKTVGLTDPDNFLVTVSQSAQVMGLSSQSNVPVDVVFVLDTSGSMWVETDMTGPKADGSTGTMNRSEAMVQIINNTIADLMALNSENRVGVVVFSAHNLGVTNTAGNADNNAAIELSPLASYSGVAASNHLTYGTGTVNWAGNVYTIHGRTASGKVSAAERYYIGGATNIQAGIAKGAEMLMNASLEEDNERVPFLIVLSDGAPTVSSSNDNWWEPDMQRNHGNYTYTNGTDPVEGNSFLTLLTAAYYKDKVSQHYTQYSGEANPLNVYTVGYGLTTQNTDYEVQMSQMTLNPLAELESDSGNYYQGDISTAWEKYVNHENFTIQVGPPNGYTQSSTITHDGLYYFYNAETTVTYNRRQPTSLTNRQPNDVKYNETWVNVGNTVTYCDNIIDDIIPEDGSLFALAYNDVYYDAANASQLQQAFADMLTEISKKAINVPTKVTTGDHDIDGYVNFYDPIGEYMEVRDMKGILAGGHLFQGINAAKNLFSGNDPEFNVLLEKVLNTRMEMTESSLISAADLIAAAVAADNQAYYNSDEDYDNSIVWWGHSYPVEGEEDPRVQVLGHALDDSVEYITDEATEIPENANVVCRSYFFDGTAAKLDHEYLYFIVRVQRSLTAPYQQTVVVSAPASLLSVEEVLINERFDEDGNPAYTASITAAPTARVIYEVGLRSDINAYNVNQILAADAAANAAGETDYIDEVTPKTVDGIIKMHYPNYNAETGEYSFYTNDWHRNETEGSHHRAMAHATFDVAADNSFYTYQADTLIVDADGNPVTAEPKVGDTVYYVREYFDWTGAEQNEDGSYKATKKTKLIPVVIPADVTLKSDSGKWYIPKGTYTNATLVVNGDDTYKTSNDTETATIVAHPHRTGDSANSHYTVLLGNNGKLTLKGLDSKVVDITSNGTTITDANGKAVMVGDTLTYTVRVYNSEDGVATAVVTDAVPAGTVYVEHSASHNGVYDAETGIITWNLSNLAAGSVTEVSFKVTVTEEALADAVRSIDNTATVTLGNNPAYKTNTTSNPPEGKKVVDAAGKPAGEVEVGQILTYTIEYFNDQATAADVIITDVIPAGTTLVDGEISHNGVYDAETRTITWTLPHVGAGVGGVVTFRVMVNITAVEKVVNQATIQIGENGPKQDTNPTESKILTGDLVLSKVLNVPTGLTPSTQTFTLDLSETGSVTGNISLNGTFPVSGSSTMTEVTFTNGKATVTIKGGETITIQGLPSGAVIHVQERSAAGFAVAYSTGSVTVDHETPATVVVTNTYSVTPVTITLGANKSLEGVAPVATVFGFTAVPCDADGKPINGTPLTGEAIVEAGKNSATVTFGTLTFSAPGTYHYLVSELNSGVAGVGYDDTQYLVTVVITDNGDGTLSAASSLASREGNTGAFTAVSDNHVVFTNIYDPIDTALALEATKILAGRDLKEGEFSFLVKNAAGDTVATGSNAANGKIVFTPIPFTAVGTFTFTIHEVIPNPENKLHGVEYQKESITVTVTVTDVDGQLVATAAYPTGGAVFTNTYTPDEAIAELEASKSLVDALGTPLTLVGGEFSFVVTENGQVVATGSNDATGKIDFSTIVYTVNDAGVHTYTITELVPDELTKDPNMYYDPAQFTVTVTVTYDRSTDKLTASDPVYADDDVVFENIKNPASVAVTPEGTKATTGYYPAGTNFSFSVVDLNGNLVTSGTSGANGDITFVAISYDAENLGSETSKEFLYWIVEDMGGTTHAGITYDGTRYLMVVTLTRNATNALVATAEYYLVDEGMDPEDPTNRNAVSAVAFSNAYQVTEGTGVELKVEKILENRELGDLKFEFGLFHVVNGQENLILTASNDASGLVTFLRNYPATVLTTYGNGDTATLHYVIRELNNHVSGVDYTEALANPIYVEVQLSHNDQGALVVEDIIYTDVNGQELTDPAFTNYYTPDPITETLEATKALVDHDGNPVTLSGNEYSFVVLENGEEVAWGKNDGNGKIVFSDIVYTQADVGTHTYTVKEVVPTVGADPNMYYDPAVFTVTVEVSYDEATGLLTAAVTYPADMEFNNIKNPDSVSVTPEGTKETVGHFPAGTRFSFSVTDLDGNVVASGVSDANGNISFAAITYDANDLGNETSKEFLYWIVEDQGGSTNAGITYDDTKYLMVVTLTRNATNALVATAEYYTVEEGYDPEDPYNWDDAEVRFSNSYAVAEGTEATMTVEKNLVGRDLGDLKFEFGLYLNGQLVATASNDANGVVTFTRVYQPALLGGQNSVTLVYEIRELNNKIPGVNYDEALANPIFVRVILGHDSAGGMTASVAGYYADAACTSEITNPTFTNSYTPDPIADHLEAEKSLVDHNGDPLNLEGDEFSFVVLEGNEEVAWGKNDANGKIVFSDIVYTQADVGTHTYTVKEVIPTAGARPNLYYDPAQFTVTVEVTYNASTGALEVSEPVITKDGNDVTAILFSNQENPTTITVVPAGNKATTGHFPAGTKFSYSVLDMNGELVVSGVSDANGAIRFGGITYGFEDLAGATSKEFLYWIVEDQGGTTNAGITYDDAKYLMVVTLTKTDRNVLEYEISYYTVAENGDPTDPADRIDATVQFNNAYNVTSGTEAPMTVHKNLVGRDLGDLKFEFGLYHNGQLVATAANDGTGAVNFLRSYSAELLKQYGIASGTATFDYVIRELNNNIHGVNYDDALAAPIYVRVVVSDDGDGTVTTNVAYYADARYSQPLNNPTFTNYYTPDPISVYLEASKSLTGRDLVDGEFSFVVLEGSKEVAWGENDGTAITFSGIQYTIADAGKTFTYTVKEVIPTVGADPNLYYDPAAFTVTVEVSYNASTGKLEYVVDYPDDMEFNNVQNPATIPVIPEGTKTIEGNDVPAGLKFSFRVVGLGTNPANLVLGAVEATGVSAGLATDEDVINFTELVFDNDDVGKTFYYLIEEVPAANSITYSTAQYGMTVRVYRDSNNFDALATEITYYTVAVGQSATNFSNWTEIRTNDPINFVNEYDGAYATLNIFGTKEMVDKDLRGGEFDFRLQLLVDGKLVANGVVDGVNVADGDKNGTIEFGTLIFTDDQMTDAFKVPNTNTTYEYRVLISEIKPETNAIPGVTYSDKQYIAVIHWTVTTDEHNQLHYGQPAIVGIYDAEYDAQKDTYQAVGSNQLTADKTDKDVLVFENVYSVTVGTDVTMQVEKVLQNRDLGDLKFEFGLYLNGQLVATATNDTNGIISFTRIYQPSLLSDQDSVTLVYEIRELNNNIPGVSYDEAMRNPIFVKVVLGHDGQGNMTASVAGYYSDEHCTIAIAEPTFTNAYTPDPITEALEANKALTGRDLVDGEFSFVVIENGVEVAWGKNDGNGRILFSDIVYTQANVGIHTYTVKEVKPTVGADPNMYYDPSAFTVTVEVTYNRATGQLETDVRYPADMTFDNIQNPATIMVTPQGNKTTTGYAPSDTEFTFSVINAQTNAVVAAGVSGLNGAITFSSIPFDTPGTYSFWIVEDKAGQTVNGITYDTAKYLMEVVISRDSYNKLISSVKYYTVAPNGDQTDASVEFNNTYTVVTGTDVTMTVEKHLEDRVLGDLKFEFGLYLNDQLVATATNNAHGVVTFTRVYQPSLLGGQASVTLVYEIRELNNKIHGVDYTKALANPIFVKVVLGHDSEGNMTASVEGYYSDKACTAAITDPTFTNKFTPDPETLVLTGTKALTGRDLVDGEFDFVALENGKEVAWGKNDGNGKIVFSDIVYTQGDVGTHTYTVKEVVPTAGADPNLYYDPVEYTVTVVVSYDETTGQLVISNPVYTKAGATVSGISFANIQNPALIPVTPEGNKTTTGHFPAGTKFSFSVLDMNGKLVAAGVSDANGDISFSSINFDTPGTYSFWIVEDKAGQTHAGITYDDAKYLMEVDISHDNYNKLISSVKYYTVDENGQRTEATVAFVNEYNVITGTEATMTVEKKLEGRDLGDLKFEFGLYLNGQLVATASNDANGVVTFTRVYQPALLGGQNSVTLVYEIRELNNNVFGVDYSDAERHPIFVKVVLGHDSEGHMTASVEGYYSDENCTKAEAEPTFTNSYTPAPIKEHLEASKSLVDHEGNPLMLTQGQFNFVVLEKGREVAWGENNNKGKIVFSDIQYTINDVGPHTYTVKEVKPTAGADPNMYYDPVLFEVTVEVTYDEATGLLDTKVTYPADMTFDNIQNPATILVTPEGTKETEGNHPDGIQFSFSVVEAKENGATVAAGISDADGNISFTSLIFDTPGTYYYWIVEDRAGQTLAGITYDDAKYLMEVIIERDSRNKLTQTVNYYTVAENGDYSKPADRTEAEVEFTNVYKVTTGTSVEIKAVKDLTGRDMKVGEFAFNLYHLTEDANGQLTVETWVASATNGENGMIRFLRNYSADILGGASSREIYYVIREFNNGLGGVDYSDAELHPIFVKVVLGHDGQGNMTASVEGYYSDKACTTAITDPTFTNTYAPAGTEYKPEGTKELIGRDLRDDEFSFVIEDLDGNPVSTGTAKADGTIDFTAIPFTKAGTFKYKILEVVPAAQAAPAEGEKHMEYSDLVYYMEVTVVDNLDGTMTATAKYFSDSTCQTEADVVFTNIYTPANITVNLAAQKTMTGRDMTDGEFSFQILDGADNVVATGGNYGSDVRFSGIGISAADLVDENGNPVLVKTFAYTMVELATSQGGVIFDSTVYTVEVTVTNNHATGELEITQILYKLDGEEVTPVFANVYDPTDAVVSIQANKTLVGKALTENEFRFELYEITAEGETLVERKGNAADGTVTFADLTYTAAGTHLYKVVEVADSGTAKENGTYTYDATVYFVRVDVTDDGNGTLTATTVLFTKDDQDVETVVSTAAFVNYYVPNAMVNWELPIEATKTVETPENSGYKLGTFEFEVTNTLGDVIATGKNDATGKITFTPAFTFNAAGWYYFRITEKTGTVPGIIYDDVIWEVHVLVSLDEAEGKLYVGEDDVHVYMVGKQERTASDKILFTNVYAPAPAAATLTVNKKLTGRDLQAGEFTFCLMSENADGSLIEHRATNDAEGKVTFRLTFDKAGTYTYALHEHKEGAGLDRVTYDKSVYAVTVVVTDDGSGKLTASQPVVTDASGNTVSNVVFTNVYTPEPIEVVLQAAKVLQGRDLKAGEFVFLAHDAQGNLVTAGKNTADGPIVFAGIKFTGEAELLLTVTEQKGSDTSVVYDATAFRVKIVVTNENGQLKAQVTYLDGEILFVNQYKEPDPENPPTGDNNPIALYAGLMAATSMALASLVLLNKKRKAF